MISTAKTCNVYYTKKQFNLAHSGSYLWSCDYSSYWKPVSYSFSHRHDVRNYSMTLKLNHLSKILSKILNTQFFSWFQSSISYNYWSVKAGMICHLPAVLFFVKKISDYLITGYSSISAKELSLCQKLWFSNL